MFVIISKINDMSKNYNIFISHHGKDDNHLQSLKQRLKASGYDARNSSVDSTKHQARRPSDAVIARYLKGCIKWAGTFICLIGESTHTRPWVNFEIRQAYLQGKNIVGIYKHGCKDSVELPEAFKRYGGTPLGWNSLDKLGDALDGKPIPAEDSFGNTRTPIEPIVRVKCNT